MARILPLLRISFGRGTSLTFLDGQPESLSTQERGRPGFARSSFCFAAFRGVCPNGALQKISTRRRFLLAPGQGPSRGEGVPVEALVEVDLLYLQGLEDLAPSRESQRSSTPPLGFHHLVS